MEVGRPQTPANRALWRLSQYAVRCAPLRRNRQTSKRPIFSRIGAFDGSTLTVRNALVS